MKRELRKKCSVGVYDFDLVVNRQITLEAFKAVPELWECFQNQEDLIKMQGKTNYTVDELEKLMDLSDALEEKLPEYVRFVLPLMVEAAGSELDIDEFIAYCEDNDVLDIFCTEIYTFSLDVFTEGKSSKKPKVKVAFK